jgi:lambda repressor-like predicted transcriptional regulator
MGKERPDWLVRLIDAAEAYIARHGSSLSSVSVKAGLHRNFLTQLMADDWREPQFGNVVKICRSIGVSITYIVTGAEMTQEQEVLLSHLARISPEQQRSVLALLESFPPSNAHIQ